MVLSSGVILLREKLRGGSLLLAKAVHFNSKCAIRSVMKASFNIVYCSKPALWCLPFQMISDLMQGIISWGSVWGYITAGLILGHKQVLLNKGVT